MSLETSLSADCDKLCICIVIPRTNQFFKLVLLLNGIFQNMITWPYTYFTNFQVILGFCMLFLLGCSVMSDSLWPYGLQYARFPCPSLSLRICWNSCPLSWWCHPIISSSVAPFSVICFFIFFFFFTIIACIHCVRYECTTLVFYSFIERLFPWL